MKKLVSILSAFVLILSLAACGGDEKQEVNKEEIQKFQGKWMTLGLKDEKGYFYMGRDNENRATITIMENGNAKFKLPEEKEFKGNYKYSDGKLIVEKLGTELTLKDGLLVESDDTGRLIYYYLEDSEVSKGEEWLMVAEYLGRWKLLAYKDEEGLEFYGRENPKPLIIEVMEGYKANFTDMNGTVHEMKYTVDNEGTVIVDDLELELYTLGGLMVEHPQDRSYTNYYFKEGSEITEKEQELEKEAGN